MKEDDLDEKKYFVVRKVICPECEGTGAIKKERHEARKSKKKQTEKLESKQAVRLEHSQLVHEHDEEIYSNGEIKPPLNEWLFDVTEKDSTCFSCNGSGQLRIDVPFKDALIETMKSLTDLKI